MDPGTRGSDDLRAHAARGSCRPKPQDLRRWRLKPVTGRSLRGVPEASLGTSSYFMLVKERGSADFVAVPVDGWVTFRPESVRPGQT